MVFIHNILKHGTNFLLSDAQEQTEQRYTDGRLFFFKNYLELADIFRGLGFFSAADFSELRASVSHDIRRAHYPLEPSPDPYFFHYTCPIQKPSVCLTSEEVKQSGGKTRRKQPSPKKRRNTRKTSAT